MNVLALAAWEAAGGEGSLSTGTTEPLARLPPVFYWLPWRPWALIFGYTVSLNGFSQFPERANPLPLSTLKLRFRWG